MIESLIRTLVPVIVGTLIAQAARVGLDLPKGATTELVTVLTISAYYLLARVIEQRWPVAGRWLVALGLTKKRPSYDRVSPPGRSPAAGPQQTPW